MSRYKPTRQFVIEIAIRVAVGLLIVASILLLSPEIAWGHPEKVQVCHVPPGNPENAHTVEVSHHAWENGHSPHNYHALDYLGPCEDVPPPPPNNGEGGSPSELVAATDCDRTVVGFVRGFNGEPIGPGFVVVWDGHLEYETDAEGRYVVEFAPEGTHTIRAAFEGTPYYFSEPEIMVTVQDCGVTHVDDLVDPPAPMNGWWGVALFFAGGYLLIVAGVWVWMITGWRSQGRTYSAIRRRNPSPRRRVPTTFPRRRR